VPKDSFLRIRGLPSEAKLSEGHEIGPGSWAVPLDALSNLEIIIPAGLYGRSEVAISLVDVGGLPLSEAHTLFVIETSKQKAEREQEEERLFQQFLEWSKRQRH
jgi:hypothetical protein